MIRSTLVILATLGTVACTPAHDATAGASRVVVSDVWCRATPVAAKTGGCYATFTASAPDRLVRVTSSVASAGEMHEAGHDRGRMTMKAVDGFDLRPGRPKTLATGQDHIMMTGLTQPFETGATVPLTFTFQSAPPVTVQAPVRPLAPPGPMAMDSGAMGH